MTGLLIFRGVGDRHMGLAMKDFREVAFKTSLKGQTKSLLSNKKDGEWSERRQQCKPRHEGPKEHWVLRARPLRVSNANQKSSFHSKVWKTLPV